MKDKLYDNADSFAMSFDEEWENVDCDDIRLKIDKVLELLSDPVSYTHLTLPTIYSV